MKTTTRAVRILCLLLALGLSGCTGMSSFFGPQTPPATQAEQAAMQAKADEAWRASRYDRALELYSLILQGRGLTHGAQITALSRSAWAELRLNRAPAALDTLARWAKDDPTAQKSWEWNSLYVQALTASGRAREAEEHLTKLMQAKGASRELAGPAAIELARLYAQTGRAGEAIRTLRQERAKTPLSRERATVEANTARMLGTLDPNALAALLAAVNQNNALTYPYNLISVEDARRAAAANPGERGRFRELAERLKRSSDLADKELPGRILDMGLKDATTAAQEAQAVPVKEAESVKPGSVAVALLLPQTGQLRVVAAKVLAGAEAAKARLAEEGIQLDIRVINSDDPGFIDQLDALPPEVMLVGGPMYQSYLQNLPASSQLSRRIFLAFTQDTPGIEEGKQIWRFFFSPSDEVNAVLGIPTESGVSRFGVLYPETRMGKRLAEAFSAAVSAHGGQVVQSRSYPPNDPTQMQGIIKDMVHAVPQGADQKTFTARPGFDAIFIPDDLAHADQIILQLRSFGADRLIILGPQLWAEALGGQNRPSISPANYRYAFCPGIWWPQSPSKSMADLKARLAKANQPAADFWSALGYDFVRLAAITGPMPADAPAQETTARLNAASQKLDWVLAPVIWDANGHASMRMFFFRPSVEGIFPVDKAGFMERLDALKAAPPAQPPQARPQ